MYMSFSSLPEDVQLNIFEKWLNCSTLGVNSRRVMANVGSRHFDYKKLKDKWIRPLCQKRINDMNILFSEVRKPITIQFTTPAGHQVSLCVLKIFSKIDKVYPTYIMKYVSTVDSSDISVWTIHHYTGIRVFRNPHVDGYIYDSETNTWTQ